MCRPRSLFRAPSSKLERLYGFESVSLKIDLPCQNANPGGARLVPPLELVLHTPLRKFPRLEPGLPLPVVAALGPLLEVLPLHPARPLHAYGTSSSPHHHLIITSSSLLRHFITTSSSLHHRFHIASTSPSLRAHCALRFLQPRDDRIKEGMMEVGLGIHNEPGAGRAHALALALAHVHAQRTPACT